MQEALKEATAARDEDEVPVGAVIVHRGRIIARARNQREKLKDPTAHAEMIALTQAAAALDCWRLLECTIYVTKEPCVMCAGALVNARIKTLVYGAKDEKAGACGSLFNLVQSPRLNHHLDIIGGVLAEDCTAILRDFFKKRRKFPA